VSPDGRYAALVEGGDITLADLSTGERRTLFESNEPSCKETDAVSCFYYNQPRWSPDGSLLAVGRSGWEWWGQFIVDPLKPFAQPPARELSTDIPYVDAELDWRTPDEACAVIGGGLNGLYLIHGPDWVLDFPDADDITGYKAVSHGAIQQCSWLDDRRIAYWMTVADYEEVSRIEVIDVDTREITTLAEFASDSRLGSMMDIFALRDGGLVVYNRYHSILHQEPPYDEVVTTPGLLRVADGTQEPILRELRVRDRVVAVVPGAVGHGCQHRVPGLVPTLTATAP
jgi:hypothetical protein